MENKSEINKKLIIEKLRKAKKISIDQAKEILETIETYCELIINYTLKNPDERP